MKTERQSVIGRRSRRGYTLIELTLAIGLAIGVSSAVVGVLGQHSTFMAILTQFDFMRDDAPQINNVMSRLTNQAVSYRLYANKQDAFDNTGAVNTGATAVRFIFRNPNGSLDQAVVAFENLTGTFQLNYYSYNAAWGAAPDWTVTSKPANVVFEDTTGVFTMTLTGPRGSQITYSGTTE